MADASADQPPIFAAGAKLLVGAVLLAAIWFRLWDLGRLPGINGDEAWYGVQAQRLIAGSGGELRTPTGNVPGLFHLGSLAALHTVFSPSGFLLRLPTLLSSLVAMVLVYVTAKRFFGRSEAIAALVLMACLPVNIAYARTGWDPSHAPMFVLGAAYAALDRRRLLAALLFALALANHPAALFTAPFLVLALLGSERAVGTWRPAVLRSLVFAGLLLLAILLSLTLSPNSTHYVVPAKMMSRLFDPDQWLAFGIGFVRLLSGQAIYESIAGGGFGAALRTVDMLTAALLLALVAAGSFAAIRRRNWLAGGVLLGWAASLFSLFLIAGGWALEPGMERFAFPLVSLTILAIAVAIGLVVRSVRPIVPAASLGLLCAALLLGFRQHYFVPLERGASRPSAGQWVGYPNLNGAALARIEAIAGPGRSIIVVEDWWIRWPLAYATTDSRFEVRDSSEAREGNYWVAYRGGPMDWALARQGNFQLRSSVSSSDGLNGLNIWSRKPKPARP